jgi:cytochrome P450
MLTLALILAFVVGGLLLWWSLALRRTRESKGLTPEDIPGWTDSPADLKMGDLGKVEAAGNLQEYLTQLHQGGCCPIKAFWWRDKRVVSVCNPDGYKQTEGLYLKPAHIFGSSSPLIHGDNGIQDVDGKEWERKKNCLYRTIRGKYLESFFNDFVAVAKETQSLWVPGEKIVLKEAIFRMTLKGILSTSLGMPEEGEEGMKKIAELYDFGKVEADERLLASAPMDNELLEEFQSKVAMLRESIKKLLYNRKESKDGGKELPLIDALLASGAPEEASVSDMMTFLGGFHGSGFYCMWVFLYLSQNPRIQQQLHMDITRVVGSDEGEKLKAYVFSSKSFLRQVLDEVFRLSSSTFTSHVSDQDAIIEGFRVPPGTPIIQAIGVTMKDSTIWDDPTAFQPDRFAPGSKHAKRGREFRPFGISRDRHCPANLFTYTMVSVYVTMITQHFDISTTTGGEVKRWYGIATAPQGDLGIWVTRRSNRM